MRDELIDELTEILESFSGEESLKEIFWSVLSYDRQRLPLSRAGLRSDVDRVLMSLELFAKHDDIVVVLARSSATMSYDQISVVCRHLTSRHPSVILLFHDGHTDTWTVIYPDKTSSLHLRLLAIPGEDLHFSARALAALTAVDWSDESSCARLDVTERLDVFFPGAMPRQRWEFDPALANACPGNARLREKAAPIAMFYHDISQYPLLTPQQERGEDLDGADLGECEMTEYRWRLVLHNVRLVINMALKLPLNAMDLEDLVQEGILALIKAARKFDPSRGCRFATYACYWIKQGMGRAISMNQNLIRWPCYRTEELVPANRAGTVDELPPGERYVESFDGSELEASDAVCDPEESLIEHMEVIDALLGCMERSLDERERRILEKRFGLDGTEVMTLKEIGQAEQLTRERIRQIEKTATKTLKRILPV